MHNLSYCLLAAFLITVYIRTGSSTDEFKHETAAKRSPYETTKVPSMSQKKKPHVPIQDQSYRYTPDWESLDSRPLPLWYDEAKFGIFIHWGVFSVPSFGSEWFWINWQGSKNPKYVEFMKKNYPPGFTYPEFGPMFTAEFFDPEQWAEILKSSGAKYIVLTSKHHEGFTLWPSKYSWNWNAVDVGPKRDLVGDLANAIRNNTDLKFGLYHSLYEWFHPLYVKDKDNNWNTQDFVKSKTMPELYEIVNKYQPSVIWSDGDWEPNDKYWNSTDFIAWLYNDSPVKKEVVVNDRWGSGTTCKHGDIYTCTDRFNPGTLQPHKWENCFTIDRKSWGFRRNAMLSDYFSTPDLIKEMVTTISCGGNMLLNVGPTHYGQIPPIYEERLRQIGGWLRINGEAIYGSRPWIFQNDTRTPEIWYTKGKGSKELFISDPVYAIILEWPKSGVIELTAPTTTGSTRVTFLGYAGAVKWTLSAPGIRVSFPSKSKVSNDWAWVLRLDNLRY
ncbi:Plasma alpha-L-fucosidase [Daphnia magna]|uniref:Putative alpha-L-fucosidase n=1 Tax=Daphnia magna TaxID=35525 RepID=A0A0P5EPC0_9CRUS|nr:Plasma alpha-L-fucosidase [Daphnia magna]